MNMKENMYVGIGYDVHRLVEDRKLILGGVEIPYLRGLKGYSDGDVLLHAICDALLGAMGEGDIGEHFPDTDPNYKNVSSIELLKKVYAIVNGSGFVINNVDTMLICEEPRIAPFKEKIKRNIIETLKLSSERVNIKATTSEGLGFIGCGEGIAAYAVVSLVKQR